MSVKTGWAAGRGARVPVRVRRVGGLLQSPVWRACKRMDTCSGGDGEGGCWPCDYKQPVIGKRVASEVSYLLLPAERPVLCRLLLNSSLSGGKNVGLKFLAKL